MQQKAKWFEKAYPEAERALSLAKAVLSGRSKSFYYPTKVRRASLLYPSLRAHPNGLAGGAGGGGSGIRASRRGERGVISLSFRPSPSSAFVKAFPLPSLSFFLSGNNLQLERVTLSYPPTL